MKWGFFILHDIDQPWADDPQFGRVHVDAFEADTPGEAVQALRRRFPNVYEDTDVFMAVAIDDHMHVFFVDGTGNLCERHESANRLISLW